MKAALLLALLLAGCTTSTSPTNEIEPCSSPWYALVEERIRTGDGHGHGPDPGSVEWRSVVEFRLGVRGDPAVPPVSDEHWCAYMAENHFRELE